MPTISKRHGDTSTVWRWEIRRRRLPPPREREPTAEPKGVFADEGPRAKRTGATAAMETYRIEVGHVHAVKPGNIVGAIANESGIDGVYIGRVDIREDHSYVDLPEGMPKKIFKDLQKVRIAGPDIRLRTFGSRRSSTGIGEDSETRFRSCDSISGVYTTFRDKSTEFRYGGKASRHGRPMSRPAIEAQQIVVKADGAVQVRHPQMNVPDARLSGRRHERCERLGGCCCVRNSCFR